MTFGLLWKYKIGTSRARKFPQGLIIKYDFVKKGMSGYFYVTVLEWASTSGSPSGRSVGWLCWGDADCQSYQQKPWNPSLLSYSWCFISASLEAVMLLLTDRRQESAINNLSLYPLFALVWFFCFQLSFLIWKRKKKKTFLYKIRHQTVTPCL